MSLVMLVLLFLISPVLGWTSIAFCLRDHAGGLAQ